MFLTVDYKEPKRTLNVIRDMPLTCHEKLHAQEHQTIEMSSHFFVITPTKTLQFDYLLKANGPCLEW